MARVGIAGATGYSGEEIVRLLASHPEVEMTVLMGSASRTSAVPAADIYTRTTGVALPDILPLDVEQMGAQSDVVFLALPHGAGVGLVPQLLEADCTVIDLSGDYRLSHATDYDAWYGWTHPAPALLDQAVYGLTEFARDQLPGARLIANPGCYATSVLMAILPLLASGIIDPEIIADSKSGLSGAGRKLVTPHLFSEAHGNVWSYKFGTHHHLIEMRQHSGRLTSAAVQLSFTPHVVPLHRGLLSTIYVRPTQGVTVEDIVACWQSQYHGEPFVRVHAVGTLPQLRDPVETNRCDMGCAADPHTGLVAIVSALDNLVKGAAGQAIQNMNVVMGWDEPLGLLPQPGQGAVRG